jgi:hypothetical protein
MNARAPFRNRVAGLPLLLEQIGIEGRESLSEARFHLRSSCDPLNIEDRHIKPTHAASFSGPSTG